MDNQLLNFTDVIKNSILKSDTFGNLTTIDIFIGLLIAYMIGMFIFFIYKKTFRGVVYSFSYNFSLVLMTMVTSLVIMTISSNIVLSLGMVGALSIVRFRTAVKDPLDIVYMFWAITAGITVGAGLYQLAVIGALLVGLTILTMNIFKSSKNTYILIVNYSEDVYPEIKTVLNRFDYIVKSKAIKNKRVELTVELKLDVENTTFVEEIAKIEGVVDAVLVNYNGEYAQ